MNTEQLTKLTVADASDLDCRNVIACSNCGFGLTKDNLPEPGKEGRKYDMEGELMYTVTACPKCGAEVHIYND